MSKRHRRVSWRVAALWRQAVLRRSGWRCSHCRLPGRLEADHIRPLHKGGTWDLENGQALCATCHAIKTARENRRPIAPAMRAWADLVQQLR